MKYLVALVALAVSALAAPQSAPLGVRPAAYQAYQPLTFTAQYAPTKIAYKPVVTPVAPAFKTYTAPVTTVAAYNPVTYSAPAYNPTVYTAPAYKPVVYTATAYKPAAYTASAYKSVAYTEPAYKAVAISAPAYKPTVYHSAPAYQYAPQPQYSASAGYVKPISILRQTQDDNFDGSFTYDYETENGIASSASGYVKNAGSEDEAQVIQGQYSYTAPDGTPVVTRWYADETGFHAEGSHIPTAGGDPYKTA